VSGSLEFLRLYIAYKFFSGYGLYAIFTELGVGVMSYPSFLAILGAGVYALHCGGSFVATVVVSFQVHAHLGVN
jgi:hypothetical protein